MADGENVTLRDATIAVLLEYLSNFWRSTAIDCHEK